MKSNRVKDILIAIFIAILFIALLTHRLFHPPSGR
jgi:hypothetical protein